MKNLKMKMDQTTHMEGTMKVLWVVQDTHWCLVLSKEKLEMQYKKWDLWVKKLKIKRKEEAAYRHLKMTMNLILWQLLILEGKIKMDQTYP